MRAACNGRFACDQRTRDEDRTLPRLFSETSLFACSAGTISICVSSIKAASIRIAGITQRPVVCCAALWSPHSTDADESSLGRFAAHHSAVSQTFSEDTRRALQRIYGLLDDGHALEDKSGAPS